MINIQSAMNLHGKEYKILGRIHFRSTAFEYQLSFVDFYKRWSGKTPDGVGYEIEILNEAEIMSWHQNCRVHLKADGELATLHIHGGEDGRPYVCYPSHIKTQEQAIRLFKEWARIMFLQIFFGFSDTYIYNHTQSEDTTVWSVFCDQHFVKNNIFLTDSL